jgi:hypothetical protein
VQFVTVNGNRIAVVDGDDWETLVEWLETLEDNNIARNAFAALQAVGGNRQSAGWLRWDELKNAHRNEYDG